MIHSDPLTIDPILVARKAIELADANPEFVYCAPERKVNNETIFDGDDGTLVDEDGYELDPFEDSCFYVHKTEDGPKAGCLFGQALHALGVELDALTPFEENPITTLLGFDSHHLDEYNRNTIQGALALSQRRQDHDDSWGHAAEPLKAFFARRELTVSAA